MDKKSISFTFGTRLKELRQERGLSHVQLSAQLKEKYGISVSRDSLMAYEVADDTRSKAEKLPNLGMRVEYLYCLADFFRVSLDYLLGKTDIAFPDIKTREICKYTGLSAQSIETLQFLNTWFDGTYLIPTINLLLEQEELPPNYDPSFSYDLDAPTEQDEEEYNGELEEWERKGYIPILSIIDNFLSVSQNPKNIYDLLVTGEILTKSKERGLKGVRLDSIREIQASDVIEQVLLTDVENKLKKLKAKRMYDYQKNKQ